MKFFHLYFLPVLNCTCTSYLEKKSVSNNAKTWITTHEWEENDTQKKEFIWLIIAKYFGAFFFHSCVFINVFALLDTDFFPGMMYIYVNMYIASRKSIKFCSPAFYFQLVLLFQNRINILNQDKTLRMLLPFCFELNREKSIYLNVLRFGKNKKEEKRTIKILKNQ